MGEGDGDMEAMPGLGVRWYGEDREETWRKCEGVKRGVTGRQRKASKRSLGKILDLASQAHPRMGQVTVPKLNIIKGPLGCKAWTVKTRF